MKGVQHNPWVNVSSLFFNWEIVKLNGDFPVSFLCGGERERDGCFQIFHDCVKILG